MILTEALKTANLRFTVKLPMTTHVRPILNSHSRNPCCTTSTYPENAYYEADMSDAESFEQWQDQRGLDAAQRANRRWKQLLQDYQAPALDDSIDEALLAFIAQRKESMPDAWY